MGFDGEVRDPLVRGEVIIILGGFYLVLSTETCEWFQRLVLALRGSFSEIDA